LQYKKISAEISNVGMIMFFWCWSFQDLLLDWTVFNVIRQTFLCRDVFH